MAEKYSNNFRLDFGRPRSTLNLENPVFHVINLFTTARLHIWPERRKSHAFDRPLEHKQTKTMKYEKKEKSLFGDSFAQRMLITIEYGYFVHVFIEFGQQLIEIHFPVGRANPFPIVVPKFHFRPSVANSLHLHTFT